MRAFCLVTALGCFALAGLGIVVQFNPAGPTGVASRSVQAVAVVSGAVIGSRWLRRPWPRYEAAVAFVVWGDITVAAVAATMSTTEARLCTTLYLGITGVFVGFLLGARLLAVHCAFGAMVIAGITGWAVLLRHDSLWGLFTIYMPALMWVVLVPLTGCVLIESGRRALARVARSAHLDQLTGLLNRRGMHAAVRRVVSAKTPPANLVVAVCDIALPLSARPKPCGTGRVIPPRTLATCGLAAATFSPASTAWPTGTLTRHPHASRRRRPRLRHRHSPRTAPCRARQP
jgi:hypothetical protein